MLLRIALILAIITAIAVAVLNFVKVKEDVTTIITQRNTNREEWNKTTAMLNATNKVLLATQGELDKTRKTLKTTETQLATAVAEAAKERKESERLTSELNKTREDRDDAQRKLAAYDAIGVSPDQVLALVATNKQFRKDIESLVNTNQLLTYNLRKTKEQLAIYIDPDAVVSLPPDLQGKVVAVDPKWNFVVLDVGQRQGVLARGEILISREGKLVARVKVRDVENDRCIANVMAGWKLADIFEGDVASSCQ
jgi:septal ring factor EnvC (AmiA/AmiB activator)